MERGRPKKIETPDRFLELFYTFREWYSNQKVITRQLSKIGEIVEIPHTPPLTWAAFDAWLFEHKHIVDSQDYRQNTDNRYEDYKGVVRAINNIMFSQKFSGAACGAYNNNIIARELGLSEKKEVENTGKISIEQITGIEVK